MSIATWHRIWLIWAAVMLGSFLCLEIYGLATDWRRTLSAFVWSFEKYKPGQPISQWSAGHFWFIAILVAFDVWLLMHFAMGWWRS